MPYFELQKEDTRFPPAHFADGDGLLAVGGSITADLLLKAYSEGIFCWHHPMKHIRWWSPDPRIVGELDCLGEPHPGEDAFAYRVNEDPEGLLRFFQELYNRKEDMGPSWLSERMFRIYIELHDRGMAISQEVYQEGTLVGGFFGICLGELCFGEYVGASIAGADTAAISVAARTLKTWGIRLMDMHKPTARDERLMYDERSRVAYIDYCKANAENDSKSFKPVTL